MPQSENYKFYTRLVLVLAMVMGTLVALAIWSTVEFIDEENDLGNENLARDVGLYILCGVGTIVAAAMLCCALAVNQETIQQIFGTLALILSVVFILISSLAIEEENSATRKRFLAFGFLIGITLFFAGLASIRLSKIKDFDASAETSKH